MGRGTIFFDYDGTLHDCMRIYGPAFRRAYEWLVEQGHASPRMFTDEWISRWLGWEVRAMWEAFAPELAEPVWKEASHLVGVEMSRLLEAGSGALFDGVPETLDKLRARGFRMALLSNCGDAYCAQHRRVFGLDRWFDAYYCAGSHPGLAKWEIYEQVAREECATPHVMVGDRFHDIEVATRAGLPSVGCAFGFGEAGELDAATVVVSSFPEVEGAVCALMGAHAGESAPEEA